MNGEVIDYLLQLCAAVAIVNQAPAGAVAAWQHEELVELWSLLRDWIRYDAAGHGQGMISRDGVASKAAPTGSPTTS